VVDQGLREWWEQVNWTLLIPVAVSALAALGCGGDDDDPVSTIVAATPNPNTTAPVATAMPTETASATVMVPTATPTTVSAGGADRAAQAARDALATWLGPVGDPASISINEVEAATWQNTCLGLTPPGEVCAQVLVEGFRVELKLAQATYEVRTDARGEITLWEPAIQILARFQQASPNIFEFRTDDGGLLAAQAVFGTRYGIAPGSLNEGDPVGLGLAEAPQSGGLLLVWLNPP
jgi:hypothetical protein